MNEIDLFFDSIRQEVPCCGYELRVDMWPQYQLILTPSQICLVVENNQFEFKKKILEFEQLANSKHPINAGILGTTRYRLTTNTLMLEGSFLVVKPLILWIIKNAK